MRAEFRTPQERVTPLRRRQIELPRRMTGKERRRLNPNRGLIKLCDRYADIFLSRFVYPFLAPLWNPYSWLLERRFGLTETKLSPTGWPRGLAPLRVLLSAALRTAVSSPPPG